MKKSALIVVAILVATGAFAAQRTFVSAQQGLDTNPCSVVAPCRTFAMALTVTDAGGEVIALDSGGYGPFAVSQSVSVTAPAGVYAGVTTTTLANGIQVGGTSAVVTLRGLTLNGLNGTGGYGVIVNATTSEVHVEDVQVYGFSSAGIAFFTGGKYFVSNSSVRDCGAGVSATSSDSNAPAIVAVDRSRFVANAGTGVWAAGYSKIVARRTVANANTASGFEAGDTAGISEIEVHGCEAAFNGTGMYASSSGLAAVNVSGSLITENTLGVGSSGTSGIFSAGDNVVHFNNTDGSFKSTFAKQ